MFKKNSNVIKTVEMFNPFQVTIITEHYMLLMIKKKKKKSYGKNEHHSNLYKVTTKIKTCQS